MFLPRYDAFRKINTTKIFVKIMPFISDKMANAENIPDSKPNDHDISNSTQEISEDEGKHANHFFVTITAKLRFKYCVT